MVSRIFLVALLAVAASAVPVTQPASNMNFGEAIYYYMEGFKHIMPCGYAPENIPVLAPFTKQFQAFSYSSQDFSFVGNVSNIRIEGLNSFDVLSGSYDVDTKRAAFDIIFPRIQLFGSMDLEGFFNVAGFPIDVRQNSLLNVKVVDLRYVGSYTLAQSLTNSHGLRIVDFKVGLYMEDLYIGNWNKLWNISTNNFVNQAYSELAKFLLQEMQINYYFNKHVIPNVNEVLANVNMSQVINFFETNAEAWLSAECNVQS